MSEPGWRSGDVLTDAHGKQWMVRGLDIGPKTVVTWTLGDQESARPWSRTEGITEHVRTEFHCTLRLIEVEASEPIDVASRVMDDDVPERVALGTGFARRLPDGGR